MQCWYHVIWNTLGSWLPGDPKGFRNRDHRIHSSGDYKKPPPKDEHQALHRYNQKRSRSEVRLSRSIRSRIVAAVLEFYERRSMQVLAIAVGKVHVHVLVKMMESYADAKAVVGKCKTIVSGAIGDVLPGTVWSRGADVNAIDTREYQIEVFHYITERQEPGTWVWDYRDGGRWQQ